MKEHKSHHRHRSSNSSSPKRVHTPKKLRKENEEYSVKRHRSTSGSRDQSHDSSKHTPNSSRSSYRKHHHDKTSVPLQDSKKNSPDLSINIDAPEKKGTEPNYELSGNLDEYTHYYRGIKINYNQPADAEHPTDRWRIYTFKDNESMKPWFIHRQPAYLIGRDRRIVDIPIDHPSCSKQHAVIQYRKVLLNQDSEEFTVKPYLIDLNSVNGTFINNIKLNPQRFYELLPKDVIKFAFSSREYVILPENVSETE